MKKILNFGNFINEARYEQDIELDRILDKIGEMGIDSITPEERSYLNGERKSEPEYNGVYNNNTSNYIDEEGNYMDPNKEDFLFVIRNVDDMAYDGTKFGITVFDKDGKYQIDEHVADMIFPELSEIQIEDLAEGEMGYYGKLTKQGLVDKLTSLGFKVK